MIISVDVLPEKITDRHSCKLLRISLLLPKQKKCRSASLFLCGKKNRIFRCKGINISSEIISENAYYVCGGFTICVAKRLYRGKRDFSYCFGTPFSCPKSDYDVLVIEAVSMKNEFTTVYGDTTSDESFAPAA